MLSKDNIQRFRTKAKIRSRNLDTVKNLSRLGTQKSQKLGQLRFNRRISKTLDSKAIEFLLKNYNPRAPRRVSVDRKSKAIDLHLLKKTFFLLNYLTGNNEIFDENDFTKLFMDFFFQLINNFKKFKVLSVNSDLMEDIIQRTQQSKLQTEEPRSVIWRKGQSAFLFGELQDHRQVDEALFQSLHRQGHVQQRAAKGDFKWPGRPAVQPLRFANQKGALRRQEFQNHSTALDQVLNKVEQVSFQEPLD